MAVQKLGNSGGQKHGRVSLGSGSNRKVKSTKVQEGGPNRFVVGKRDVAVDTDLMSGEFNYKVPGRGKRTVRKRRDEDDNRLVNRMTDFYRPKLQEIEEEEDEEEEEGWAGENGVTETPSTPVEADDGSDNSLGVESEDEEDYSERNKWGVEWRSNRNEATEDIEEEEEEVGARVEEEDVEMSESSEEEEEEDEDYSSSDS